MFMPMCLFLAAAVLVAMAIEFLRPIPKGNPFAG